MSEILSLAELGATALTEAVKFLYAQAGDLLRRRRDRAEYDVHESMTESAVLAEPCSLPNPDLDAVGRLEAELRKLRTDLHDYVDAVDPQDAWLVSRTDALRRVLEVIYGTPLIFAGEHRTEPQIRGRITADDVAGYVAAVRADRVVGGAIDGEARVKRVYSGAEVVGIDLGTTGSGKQ
ncbi:MAG: hypothetical protein ACT4NY_15790 [Pseudonocardiales bacterium]